MNRATQKCVWLIYADSVGRDQPEHTQADLGLNCPILEILATVKYV